MALDAKARTEQARKAAGVLAKKRKDATQERDIGICRAFAYLSGDESQGITEKSLAFKFLLKHKHGVKLPDGQKATRFLADAFKLTPQRIDQIVKKGRK